MTPTLLLHRVRRPWRAAGLPLILSAALPACVSATSGGAAAQAATPPAAPAATAKPGAPGPPAPAPQTASGTDAAARVPTITAADGTRIAYEVSGSGPALLLIHGGGQTRKSWAERGYVDRLAKKFTVIRMDLRGSGDSGRPDTLAAYSIDTILADLLAVADAAGAKRFHVWGFGHGGSVARALAAQSDRVISAVIVAADMGVTLSGPVKEALLAMRAKWMPLLEAQKAGTLDLKKLSPGDREAWNSGVALHALALGAIVDYPPVQPADIKAPTLWLLGAADAGAMENAKLFEGKLAGTKVTLKTLSGLSYSDTFARIDPVLAEVEPFLASTAAPPSE